MYNRYIPQSDGTYRRNRMQDTPEKQEQSRVHHRHACPPAPESKCEVPTPLPRPVPCPKIYAHHSGTSGTGISGFLRQLLPKEFDTGDLLVVILLLLISGDCDEDQNWALLTLALYFFL